MMPECMERYVWFLSKKLGECAGIHLFTLLKKGNDGNCYLCDKKKYGIILKRLWMQKSNAL